MNRISAKKFESSQKYQNRSYYSQVAASIGKVSINPFYSVKTEGDYSGTPVLSDSQKNMICKKQPTLNSMFQKFVNRQHTKTKIFKIKKKAVQKCEFGIGYEVQPYQVPNIKLIQDFFPHKSFSLIKRLATRHTEYSSKTLKVEKENIILGQFLGDRQKPRSRRQKTSIQLRKKNELEPQLKIKSIGKSLHFHSQFEEESGIAYFNRFKQKRSYEKKPLGLSCKMTQRNKQEVQKQKQLTPWEFEDNILPSNQDYNILTSKY